MKNSNKYFEMIKRNLVFIIIIAIIVLSRIFVFAISEVDGSSMEPNLQDENIVITEKMFYPLYGIDRFDIVVFKYYPTNMDTELLIKRVIGLPGEEVAVKDGQLYIDGEAISIPDDMEALDAVTNNFNFGVVPDDAYFVLGDNRVNSKDSRYIGAISNDDLVGRVILRIRPFSEFTTL